MYIKTIVLDGFKTYAKRTEISGFDSQFNAITGLNGSGKSNILDAICFALGMSELQYIRVHSQQELIYKKGQTGVTKASVTLIFDNSDPAQCPAGFEQFREITVTRMIVIGGKTKYLLNGVNAPINKIKDLFSSVQLNIQKPHFLVQQGRITKVLNMKAIEILEMVEEAAGTSYFERKKKESEKKLAAKDAKLADIDITINQDVAPKLEKLREEKGQYMEFKKVERELEHSSKIYIALQYSSSKDMVVQNEERTQKIIESINDKRQRIEQTQSDVEKIDREIEAIRDQVDADDGGAMQVIEKEISTENTKFNQVFGAQKQNAENIEDEKKKIKDLEKNIKDDENVLRTKNEALRKINSTYQKLVQEEETDKNNLEKARQKYQAMSTGMIVDDEGNEETLQDKIMAAQRAVADAKLEVETIKRKKPHCESERKNKSTELARMETEFRKDIMTQEKLEKEVVQLKQSLGVFDKLKDEERQLNTAATHLRRKRDAIEQRDGRLSFRYQDPEPGFCRKSVHGLVCRLIEVTDPNFCQAIEKTAGGRLFNVVVDNDVTSRNLLKNGRLERRTTIIPLNKISGRRLNPRVVEAAQRIAGADNVWPASSLIKFNNVLQPAMDYIFGTTLICRDIYTAKKVCYHPDVKTRCVTLDGDVCDPSGTLSGGAQERSQPILPMLQELRAILHQLDEKDTRLIAIERELAQMGGSRDVHGLKQRLDIAEDHLLSISTRLSQTTQYKQELEALNAEIDHFNKRLSECESIISRETKNIADMKANDDKSNKEKLLKAADAEVQKCTKKYNQSRKEVLKRKEEYDAITLDLNELNSVIASCKEQVLVLKTRIEKLEGEGQALKISVAEAKESVEKVKLQLKSMKDVINKKNKEIAKLSQNRDKLEKEAAGLELEIKQDNKDHDRIKQEAKDAKSRVSQLRKDHDWIAQEEEFFGRPKGVYDFSDIDPQEIARKVSKLKELKEKLGRTLNTKALNLLSATEEEYNQVMEKRKKIEEDKQNIITVISDLGEKKNESLKIACDQVGKDFGTIFSTLLPGAEAQLLPSDGKSVLNGLRFRIGFGGQWKENLAELSGGQRSLVALSLMLSLLLYNPAPVYILDEVDAALDLSHTQNIGSMLKNHFTNAQFIIVSLKDGMFNNANVLFRAKFVDGVSVVSRTAQSTSHQ